MRRGLNFRSEHHTALKTKDLRNDRRETRLNLARRSFSPLHSRADGRIRLNRLHANQSISLDRFGSPLLGFWRGVGAGNLTRMCDKGDLVMVNLWFTKAIAGDVVHVATLTTLTLC